VFKRRGKSWTYVVDVGTDPGTGRRRQQTKGGFATRKAAEQALGQVVVSVADGRYVTHSPTTLSDFLVEWLETTRPRLRETTWFSYKVAVDRVVRELGAVKLQALKPLQIEACYARLLTTGGKAGRPLAPKTVRNCHIVLHRALGDAERLGLVTRNPTHAAKAPVGPRKEMATWTAEELGTFLEHVRGDPLFAAYVLLATTGMRRGEVLGLRWTDVDIEHRRLGIVQSLTTINDDVFLGPTKSVRSRRNIAIDTETAAALKAHRKAQAAARLAAGEIWDSSYDLVFCDGDGTPLHPDRFTAAFKRHVRAAGVPMLRGPHGLRHTWATLALKAGVHPKVVSDRLGHSTIAITIDTYSHVAPSLDAGAADIVAAQIFHSSTSPS
jgi:integrase